VSLNKENPVAGKLAAVQPAVRDCVLWLWLCLWMTDGVEQLMTVQPMPARPVARGRTVLPAQQGECPKGVQ
jgi:hypothetical protein